MGEGYAVLIWDNWGSGLVRINPRLLTVGIDIYGNPNNWFPCNSNDTDDIIAKKHNLLEYPFWEIIR